MHYTFHCAIIGYGTTFPVNIDGTQSVGELKKRIKEAKKHALASIDPDRLMLHKANINISKSDIRKKVMQQIQQNWIKVDGEEMVSAFEVSDYWEKSKLPKRTIHILVKLPLGESIDSRACSAVAEMHLPNNLVSSPALSFH